MKVSVMVLLVSMLLCCSVLIAQEPDLDSLKKRIERIEKALGISDENAQADQKAKLLIKQVHEKLPITANKECISTDTIDVLWEKMRAANNARKTRDFTKEHAGKVYSITGTVADIVFPQTDSYGYFFENGYQKIYVVCCGGLFDESVNVGDQIRATGLMASHSDSRTVFIHFSRVEKVKPIVKR